MYFCQKNDIIKFLMNDYSFVYSERMYKMFFQKDAETMSRKQIEEIQLNRLKWLVDYCCKNIPFYHDRLEKAE